MTEDRGNGVYLGNVLIALGPFSATFEGEAKHAPDASTMSGNVEGKAVDKKGGSRSRLSLRYQLAEVTGLTQVDFEADIQLAGPIAQFGRVGIIEEAAQLLIEDFVKNVEREMALGDVADDATKKDGNIDLQKENSSGPQKSRSLSAAGVLWSLLKRYLGKLFS